MVYLTYLSIILCGHCKHGPGAAVSLAITASSEDVFFRKTQNNQSRRRPSQVTNPAPLGGTRLAIARLLYS